MCITYITKYLCTCIHTEWHYPCTTKPTSTPLLTPFTLSPIPPPRPSDSWCHSRILHTTHNMLTYCEDCYAILHARLKKDGLRKVLDDAKSGRFALGETLGMLVVLFTDEMEQWRLWRGGEQHAVLKSSVEVLEGGMGVVSKADVRNK
ncbi:hypothetical protein BJY04DRAFT_220636 [Aspergillus karnatakaensis]|uniref:uncharacterized protein n=1 Tax=Aspergillus karnatakaensis TaxID=1810916 RepID=UPI003CCE0E4F